MMRDHGELETVLRYHERTKHHFNRYASGPGFLDWAIQPNPFRRYEGASLMHLPRLGRDEEPRSPAYEHLYRAAAVPSAKSPAVPCPGTPFPGTRPSTSA